MTASNVSLPAHPVHHSFDEYVRLERASNVKHEYLDGRIYAMAGGTPEHAALTAAVSGLLFGQLRGKPCRVYSSDLRVRASDLTTYPDITVVCGTIEPDPGDANTALNPTLLVEVTSPSTEEYDRGEKLAYYRQISSLKTLLLVSHREARIEVWSRRGNAWQRTVAELSDRIVLDSIGCELLVKDVYENS